MLKVKHIALVPLLLGFLTLVQMPQPIPPPGPIGPYLNGIFPPTPPGASSAWELEDPFPDLTLPPPVRIVDFPGSDSDIAMLSKIGQIWRLNRKTQEQSLILDITDRSFKKGEAGAVGMVFHPQFTSTDDPARQVVFIYYRTKPEPDSWSEKGFNRLSKFTWDPAIQAFDPASEEILIQQYDRSTWHNSGAMFFGPDGFLYLSLGDEGMDEHQPASTQRLDGGFFSGILRIDVDNDPARSHPIRRQPRPNEAPPAGWGQTFSQGYSIPHDNPWQAEDGSILEEFYAIGIRSPYVMSYDPDREFIWLADVGAGQREEINQVDKGDNLQWPYLEGSLPFKDRQQPDELIGREKPPYYEYDRSIGACIIGGALYRGEVFPNLNGKYLFADYISNKLMALSDEGSFLEPEREDLIEDLEGQPVDLPDQPGITGVFVLKSGEVLVTVMGQGQDFAPGKVLRLRKKTAVPDPPVRLSELGAFTDLATLTPAPGILPYRVNAQLWSDRAEKQRWIALPNDGDFDQPDELIRFQATDDWRFPEGTVFIKHFELPLNTDGSGERARLETRFFVVGKDGRSYGLTYQWNEEGTEAFLLGGGASRTFAIRDEQNQIAMMQTWDYPSRGQCLTCHNANANYVLGVKTHQLNGDVYYPHLGQTMNQLDYLNSVGAFGSRIGNADRYAKAYPLTDESVDLELRIRSYLDANCASCHRAGGVPNLTMDVRFSKPLLYHNTISAPALSHSSLPNRNIIEPGVHEESEFWVRDASLSETRMPPIGRNIIDETYIDLLAQWIDGLPPDAGRTDETIVFPNPSSGQFDVRITDAWEPPYEASVYSLAGNLLWQNTGATHALQIDLTNQPAGIYLLEVVGGGRSYRKKLVKK